MGSGDDCEHDHPLMSPNSAVAVCPDCGGHMWHDDESWQHATGGASVLAAEVQRLRAAMTEANAAMRECIEAHYVGGGRVVCTNSLKPHLDEFAKLLADTPKGGA